jgi:MFS family permease
LEDIYEGLKTEEEREAAYEKFVWQNLKRNYTGHFLHGMLGMTGFRLFNAPTFIPAYLHMLSGSDVIVGLGLGLQQFGGVVSPIVGATLIEYRKHVLSLSMWLGTMMRIPILAIALAGWLVDGTTLLATVMFFLFVLGLFSGPQGVAFQFLLAKMIPISWRGRLQGLRNVTGGLIAAVLSYFAGEYLVGGNFLGNGYSATFMVAFILTSMGLTAFGFLVREPEPPSVRPRMRVRDRVRDFVPMLRNDKDFGYFMIARTFAITNRVATPFYIVYAAQTITLSGTTIGILTFAYLIADTLASLGWGYLADKSGFRAPFIIALVLWIVSTILLMGVSTLPFFALAFFGLGAANSGYQMSAQNIVFEFGHRDDMAMRLALSNTAEASMSTIGPLAGGLIAAAFGYLTMFGVTVACEVIALIVTLMYVNEPRKRRRVQH